VEIQAEIQLEIQVEIRQYKSRWKSSSFPKETSPVLPKFLLGITPIFGIQKWLSEKKKYTFKKSFGFGIPGWVVSGNGKRQRKVLTLTPVVLQTNIDVNLTRINDRKLYVIGPSSFHLEIQSTIKLILEKYFSSLGGASLDFLFQKRSLSMFFLQIQPGWSRLMILSLLLLKR